MSYEEMEKKKQKPQNKSSDGLDLSGKIWQEIDRVLCLPRYHNIKILKINNSSLATIPLLPHGLEILDLSRNHIERIQGLSNLSFLRVLKLNHNELRRLEGLSKNYQIEELHVSHNHLTHIENLYQLPLLHSLDLRFNQLSHFDLLRRLEDNLNLRVLYVEGNEFAIRAHNFQTFVFQQLPFLTMVDGKSVHQALANKSNYYKQQRQKKMAQKRRKSTSDSSSTSSVISDTASTVKPGYMKATICKKLKTGYTHHNDQKTGRSNRPRTLKNVASRKSLKSRDRASGNRGNRASRHPIATIHRVNGMRSGNKAMVTTATQPNSWMNFNHYSMKQKSSREKPSIYDYSTPKKSQRVHAVQTGRSLAEPDMDSNSSCPAIPIATKNNLVSSQRTKRTKQMIYDLTKKRSGGTSDDSNSLKNFRSRHQPKTKMQDVIKKLNEKINKLYSWHLVEIDLVSKQQMQLNEIRSELSTTRQSLANHVTSTIAGSMATPLRLLSTPRSATSGVTLDLLETNGQKAESDNVSSMTTRSALQLNNPNFVKNTLQKCYDILKQDNATATELEAVENLVLQLESDMAANAQLESLQKEHKASKADAAVTENETERVNSIERSQSTKMEKEETDNSVDKEQNQLTKATMIQDILHSENAKGEQMEKDQDQESELQSPREEDEQKRECEMEMVETNQSINESKRSSTLSSRVQVTMDAIAPDMVSESLDLRSETNSMIEQFNAYNEEINKLERELKNIDVSHGSCAQSEVVMSNASLIMNQMNQIKKYETKQTMTQSIDIETNDREMVKEQNVETTISPMEEETMGSWLSELADELNTAKMSLKHLMDISSASTANRSAKVKEFDLVATKCDMFSSFEISPEIEDIIENKLAMANQMVIRRHLHELQMIKDAIRKLIFHVVQKKDENVIANQRHTIKQQKLSETKQYEMAFRKILES